MKLIMVARGPGRYNIAPIVATMLNTYMQTGLSEELPEKPEVLEPLVPLVARYALNKAFFQVGRTAAFPQVDIAEADGYGQNKSYTFQKNVAGSSVEEAVVFVSALNAKDGIARVATPNSSLLSHHQKLVLPGSRYAVFVQQLSVPSAKSNDKISQRAQEPEIVSHQTFVDFIFDQLDPQSDGYFPIIFKWATGQDVSENLTEFQSRKSGRTLVVDSSLAPPPKEYLAKPTYATEVLNPCTRRALNMAIERTSMDPKFISILNTKADSDLPSLRYIELMPSYRTKAQRSDREETLLINLLIRSKNLTSIGESYISIPFSFLITTGPPDKGCEPFSFNLH